MTDYGLDLAVIGNGRTAALLEPSSRIVWWCMPRYDGDPVFCRLLAGKEDKGFTDVVLDGLVETKSDYVRNTAIVATELIDSNGGAVRITDFAPRFQIFGRTFRPPQLMRIIEPIRGMPRVTIRFRSTHRYGEPVTSRSSGSNHIRYWRDEVPVRLTTDAPLSYVENEASFVLTRPVHLVFGTDEPFEGSLETTCRDFCDRTHDYWVEWVRRLAFSIDWQDEIIRAAITLKLCNYEETGAIVAALTTSIPEVSGSGRNWDYRFCWMRDAFFVVRAFNRIGATRTMEDFISYILSVAGGRADQLRPFYGVVHTDVLEERTAPALAGYGGDGPVRIGNAAVNQKPARRLRQHHHGGNADVLRSKVAASGRRRVISHDRAARRTSSEVRARAGFWHLGISRTHACAHAFGGDVLGGLPASCGDCKASQVAGTGDLLGRHFRPHRRGSAQARLESQAQGVFGGVRQRRTRCQCVVAGRARFGRARRPSVCGDCRDDRP